MDFYEDYFTAFQVEAEADDLGEEIEKQFGKYKVCLKITKWETNNDRIIYQIKEKGNTREAHIRAHAPDVQLRLKLPMFYVVKHNFTLFLIVSRKKIACEHLPVILNNPTYRDAQKKMQLPYIVGHNVIGNIVMDDLARFPHLLLGGSTNSGKSVGLQALITSIAYSKLPSQVNFILLDVGATNLMPFEGLPHLACSVVRDRTNAMHTLAALNTEMERRVALGYTSPSEFKRLPRLVVVIDEFPALFMGGDKILSKRLANFVSSLLQRGRHAKIHLVLAAQNPTYQNMKIDLGNITARIAFKCAKKNFSETILGEGGAESLMGNGDLLLKSPRYDGPQRVQGINITPGELRKTIQIIKAYHHDVATNKFNLVLPIDDVDGESGTLGAHLSCSVVRKWPPESDQLLASVILWALGRDSISINMLMNEYQLGWNNASKLVRRLEELGIVDRPEGKLPRKVVPSVPEEISDELIKFLKDNGYSQDCVIDACYGREDN